MSRLIRLAELASFAVGALLLGFAAFTVWATGHAADRARAAATLPDGAAAIATPGTPPLQPALLALAQADWAPGRIRAHAAAAAAAGQHAPEALLRIPRLAIETAVFDGTTEWALNLGVGRIEGTARVGQRGNLALAGHRDGWFRRLERIAPGDTIDVVDGDRRYTYVVERTLVVDPEDVHVLDATPHDAITLVTCYPFQFVGRAPQRFVVRGTRVG